ncbi:TPA: hypothetical protein JLG68_001370 [Escherichia coli]|nr:hypothetical protein [Escherichia coli]
MTIPTIFPIATRGLEAPNFVLYEEPSANGVTRVEVAMNAAKHSALKIGHLVDADCKPVAPAKVAADITGKVKGVSMCAFNTALYDPLTGGAMLTTQGETSVFYIRPILPRYGITLKDSVIDYMVDYHTDASVTDAKVIAAIRAEIMSELEGLGFELVSTGL